MKRAVVVGWLALGLVTLGVGVAAADSWDSPKVTKVTSPSGIYTVTMTPEHGPVLFLQKSGVKVYERIAVNSTAPVELVVADSGHVATVDDWYGAGYNHAVVIYAPDGRVVTDRRLEEVLALDELKRVRSSVSSRWWRTADPKIEKDLLVIPTDSGDVQFRFSDGAPHRGGKPFALPTDEERLTGYALGMRPYANVTMELHEASDLSGVKCEVTPKQATCSPFGDDKRKARKRKLPAHAFEKALRSVVPLGPLANTEDRRFMRGPHWYIVLTFEESGQSYPFEILLSRTGASGAVLDAVRALRALTPLR